MKKRLVRPTPEEDVAIQRGIDADPDTWEVTEKDWARARPMRCDRARRHGPCARRQDPGQARARTRDCLFAQSTGS